MNIFNSIASLFGAKEPPVPQGGLIIQMPKTGDWFFQGAPVPAQPIEWRNYMPVGQSQSNLSFDTMACTTFSALDALEMQFKQMTLPLEHQQFLSANGYYQNGQVTFSRKFTALISGTTTQGNTFQNVGNSLRHDGVLPNSRLPFGSATTFADWYNPNQINPQMIDLGQQFARYFDITYEFVLLNDDGILSPAEITNLESALASTPLQIAIPFPGTHAVVLTDMNDSQYGIFDSYLPYFKEYPIASKMNFAMKITVSPKVPVEQDNRVLQSGCAGADVAQVQAYMNICLWSKMPVDGHFGPMTKQAVMMFQAAHGLDAVDGIVGKLTWQKIASQAQPIAVTSFKEPSDDVDGVNPYLMSILQRVRTATGLPMKVTSGKRGLAENENVGGVSDSSHLAGLAIDFLANPSIQDRFKTLLRNYGIKRIGSYPLHIHADIDLSKAQVEWQGTYKT